MKGRGEKERRGLRKRMGKEKDGRKRKKDENSNMARNERAQRGAKNKTDGEP